MFGVEDAGRWALIRRKPAGNSTITLERETAEQIARTLLKRYGVIFWRMLAREADWLPPWRELLMACRRLETRGEIRGGRFVAGFSGEQFALPEAVGVLRGVRSADKSGRLVTVSGVDPLNLAGIVLPGTRVPAIYSNRVMYRDGVDRRRADRRRSPVLRESRSGKVLGAEKHPPTHPRASRTGCAHVVRGNSRSSSSPQRRKGAEGAQRKDDMVLESHSCGPIADDLADLVTS